MFSNPVCHNILSQILLAVGRSAFPNVLDSLGVETLSTGILLVLVRVFTVGIEHNLAYSPAPLLPSQSEHGLEDDLGRV